jgi:methionine-S-sulfoxide reductase
MTKSIILGGGCFWCTEAVFSRVPGVKKATPGYAGGMVENPTYDLVSTGSTGHAEVIKVEYDDSKVSLKELISLFFRSHDPTTKDRQGNDFGTQYRSLIICDKDEEQKVKAMVEEAQSSFSKPITTGIMTSMKFYRAEESHMEYYEKHKGQPYCFLVIRPKLKKLGFK